MMLAKRAVLRRRVDCSRRRLRRQRRDLSAALDRARAIRARTGDRTFSDSVDLLREDRSR
jgi:hypothetical protein